jgi:predicted esterase
MQHEDGFDFHFLPSAPQPAKALIIILHGYGSHPDQYMKWAKKTQGENPEADVLVVRAPLALHATEAQKQAMRLPNVDDLYGWYSLEKKNSLKEEFNPAATLGQLNRFIDAQMKRRGLSDENLALIGFSQGAMVALGAALSRPSPCAAVVSHSGLAFPFNRAASPPPDVLMIMGDADDLFLCVENGKTAPPSRTLQILREAGIKDEMDHASSVKRLKSSSVPVTEKIFPNQAHRITEASWHEASDFVAKKLKLKK